MDEKPNNKSELANQELLAGDQVNIESIKIGVENGSNEESGFLNDREIQETPNTNLEQVDVQQSNFTMGEASNISPMVTQDTIEKDLHNEGRGNVQEVLDQCDHCRHNPNENDLCDLATSLCS